MGRSAEAAVKQIKARIENQIEAKLSKSTRSVIRNVVLALLALLVARAAAVAQEIAADDATPQRQIVVSIADRKLALIEDGEVVRIYPVAVGKGSSPSPTGDFQIVNRLEKPTYYRPHTVIGPGPENPLGTRWIGLNKKGFGIHGTNEPGSIGKAASHGCIRMPTDGAKLFYDHVKVGTPVDVGDY